MAQKIRHPLWMAPYLNSLTVAYSTPSSSVILDLYRFPFPRHSIFPLIYLELLASPISRRWTRVIFYTLIKFVSIIIEWKPTTVMSVWAIIVGKTVFILCTPPTYIRNWEGGKEGSKQSTKNDKEQVFSKYSDLSDAIASWNELVGT